MRRLARRIAVLRTDLVRMIEQTGKAKGKR
jgi:hypothetical protein